MILLYYKENCSSVLFTTSENNFVTSTSSKKGEPRNKISRTKCFQEAWFEEFPSWKQWVVRLEDETKFYCTICDKKMECVKAQILRHESSSGHQQKEQVSEKLTSYGILFKSNSSNLTSLVLNVDYFAADQQFIGSDIEDSEISFETAAQKRKVVEAEIKITTFFLEHNLSFAIAPELIGLFQGMEPAVLRDVKLSSTKMRSVATNVVSKAEADCITKILRVQSFSVYEDETSDRTQEKWLSLMVRYVEPSSFKIRFELLQLINLDASDCSADKVFKAFEGALCEKQIPLSNVAGMSCDHAQVRIGNKSSFETKLKEKNPNVIVIPCVSHSMATAAKYSCAKIPDVENIIKSIPSSLNGNSKRTNWEVFFTKFLATLKPVGLFVINVLLLFSIIWITFFDFSWSLIPKR